MGIPRKIDKRQTTRLHARTRCPACGREMPIMNGKMIAHGKVENRCEVSGFSVREYLKMKATRVDVVKAEAVNGSFIYLDLKGQKVDSDNVNVLFTVPATVKAVKSY